jgi:hypothetical protein
MIGIDWPAGIAGVMAGMLAENRAGYVLLLAVVGEARSRCLGQPELLELK